MSYRFLSMVIFSLSLLVSFRGANAQESYPSAPVTLVVPYAAGGSLDVQGRLLAERLSKKWGQPVVVENRPGAGGMVGAEYVSRRKPDGRTLLLIGNAIGSAPLINKAVTFDPFKAFTPITHIASGPYVIIVPPLEQLNTLQDFIRFSKDTSSKKFYAALAGIFIELDQLEFFKRAEIDPSVVYYSSGAEVLSSVMTNQAQSSFLDFVATGPMIKAGKVKAVAVTGRERLAVLPDVPTVGETLPGYEANLWYGLYGPANVPPTVTQKIFEDVREIVAEPEVKSRLESFGLIIDVKDSASMMEIMKNDYATMKTRVQESGWKPK